MGLITAAGASLASVLGDQWKEYFYCSEMDADVLVRKGVGLPKVDGNAGNGAGQEEQCNKTDDGS